MFAELNRTANSNKNPARGTASSRECATSAMEPSITRWQDLLCLLRLHQFPLRAWLVFDNVPRHGARRHRQRTGQVHLPGPTATREIAVLRADDNLFRPRGHAWSGVDAGTTARFDYIRSGSLENFEIAFTFAVIARLLRTKLDVELHRLRNAL